MRPLFLYVAAMLTVPVWAGLGILTLGGLVAIGLLTGAALVVWSLGGVCAGLALAAR